MLVPKLRFNDFNDAWIPIKLKNISLLITKGTTPLNFAKEGINYIRIESIQGYEINNKNCLYIDEQIHKTTLKRSILENHDILFAIAGATIGKCALVQESNLPANTNQALAIIRLEGNINPYFIICILDSSVMKRYIKENIAVGAQPNLNLEQMGNFQFSLPSKVEQTKIATFLSFLDRKIELQRRKLEVLKEYKLGIIQEIYNNSDNSTKVSLKDILIEKYEKSIENNQYEVISSTKEGLFLQKDYFNRSIASENNIGYKILRREQIVFSPQNLWMGNINYNNIFDVGIVSPSYKILEIKNNYNKYFIATLLKTSNAIYLYNVNSEQGASVVRKNLNMDLFYEITFYIPNIELQNKIANVTYSIDKKIQLEEFNLQNLQKLKKSLLQKMFI